MRGFPIGPWLNPLGYVSTRLLMPLFLTLIFGYLVGSGTPMARATLLGGGLYAVFLATLTGTALSVANERRFGTLAGWLATPQPLALGLACRALPHLVDGLLSGAFVTMVGGWLLSVPDVTGYLGGFACAALPAGLAGVALGQFAVAVSIRFRDVFTVPNVGQSVILVTSGAVLPGQTMPDSLREVGPWLPLGNAVAALHPGQDLLVRLAAEVAVDAVYGTLGYVILRRLIAAARRHSAFELA
jgi:ABC-2 type transport system permease protein